MTKQLLAPCATHCMREFLIENYGRELFNCSDLESGTHSIFTTAVCKCHNVNDKYSWDNAADLKKLSMVAVRIIGAIKRHFYTW